MNFRSKTIFQINQGQITHEMESVKFHLNIPHSKGTTGKKHFLIQSRADNSQTGKVRVTVLSHNM